MDPGAPREAVVSRNLILVLSAFTSLIAVVTLADGALIPSNHGVSRLWMLGVLVAGGLCWLRWRWSWRNSLLAPALIVGAAMLASFAAIGLGDSVQLSATGVGGSSPRGIMDVLLGAQAILMFSQLWRDRRQPPAADQPSHKSENDPP